MSIHRLCCRLALSLVIICCGLTSQSFGQQHLRSDIVTADPAAACRPQIDTAVREMVKNLQVDAPATQKQARDEMVETASRAGATVSFLDQYFDSINTQIQPALANPNLHVRLNAAVAVGRLCEKGFTAKANIGAFTPSILAILKAKEAAVALWGVKAAKYEIAYTLQTNAKVNALVDAVIATMKAQATPAIVEEGYEGISLRLLVRSGGITEAMAKEMLPRVMALMAERLSDYQSGSIVQPIADTFGSDFLVSTRVWTMMSSDQRSQAVQAMISLTRAASKQNATTADAVLVEAIRRQSRAFEAIGNLIHNQKVVEASRALNGISENTSPDDIDKRINDLSDRLKDAGFTITDAAEAPAAKQ